eukprot:jgi/Botrbrau1/15593/Bobra.0246s0007.1
MEAAAASLRGHHMKLHSSAVIQTAFKKQKWRQSGTEEVQGWRRCGAAVPAAAEWRGRGCAAARRSDR